MSSGLFDYIQSQTSTEPPEIKKLEQLSEQRGGCVVPKRFNISGSCNLDEHYMVNIQSRLVRIKQLVDMGQYFTVNRGRQYGKTTTLFALEEYLNSEYIVISLDLIMNQKS